MKIIVDTNIIFSSLLKNGKSYRDILYNVDNDFFSCNFLIVEIFKHKEKIIKNCKMSESEVLEELHKILKIIKFVNEKYISNENLIKAYNLCKNIDPKDTLFIGLTLQLNGLFWTGDKKLKKDLKGEIVFFS